MSHSRDLPSVDRLAASLGDVELPRRVIVATARAVLAEARSDPQAHPRDPETTTREALTAIARQRMRPVINATGVLLHTNLGRSPIVPEAAAAASVVATGYANLELDLDSGNRGGRGQYLEGLLTELTGAEGAMAVANNAGGVLLTLAALAGGRQVPVSRGELIEIGGSYRLPELMEASGAIMVEVGTTNRTRLADYAKAVTESTALLLKVHPSNYRIEGFSEDASIAELTALAGERGIPLVFDAGSGLVDNRVPWLAGPPPVWLHDEPGIRQSIEAGADLVLFSGDKLFGGPQAGIIVGSPDLISQLKAHPVARAMRLDGPTLAALTVTAEFYADGRGAELPIWRMVSLSYEELEERARRMLDAMPVAGATIKRSASTPGAGSVPGSEIASPVISIDRDPDRVFLRLLTATPPVLARREAGSLLIDLRCVPTEADEELSTILGEACRS